MLGRASALSLTLKVHEIPPPAATVVPYEQARLKKISANKQFLATLNIESLVPKKKSPRKKETRKRKGEKPVRQSERLQTISEEVVEVPAGVTPGLDSDAADQRAAEGRPKKMARVEGWQQIEDMMTSMSPAQRVRTD